MRAIIHLGFSGICSNRAAVSSESVSGRNQGINDWRRSVIALRAGNSLPKFHPTRINRLQASQNAAALLFDFSTVDIR
jgi:hypothetical protein